MEKFSWYQPTNIIEIVVELAPLQLSPALDKVYVL